MTHNSAKVSHREQSCSLLECRCCVFSAMDRSWR